MNNIKRKGETIFKRDLEISGCGYRSVCKAKNCNLCTLELKGNNNFNFTTWENMRKEMEDSYGGFWK